MTRLRAVAGCCRSLTRELVEDPDIGLYVDPMQGDLAGVEEIGGR